MRSGLSVASTLLSDVDRQAGFLRQVAQEEVGLGELRGGDQLALEVVDLLDVGADDEPVGAARVADLHRHHGVELAAVGGQHVHGRDRAGDLALVQVAPALVLADRQLDLEAAVLEEHRVLGGLEAAVGGDDPGVAGVLADLDGDDVVLQRERRRRRQPRHLRLEVDDGRRLTGVAAAAPAARASIRHPRRRSRSGS